MATPDRGATGSSGADEREAEGAAVVAEFAALRAAVLQPPMVEWPGQVSVVRGRLARPFDALHIGLPAGGPPHLAVAPVHTRVLLNNTPYSRPC